MERKPDAVIDEYQESVLSMIDAMFPNMGLLVSRGHSTPLEQLGIIDHYSSGFQYPEFNPADVHEMAEVDYEGKSVSNYAWWRTWGECLHRGIIVNPPLAAMVPYDYFKGEVNQKGMLKHASNHEIAADADPSKTPCPIDFSQKINGLPDILKVYRCMEQAKAAGIPIEDIVIEHGNGCVHIDLKKKV